MTALSYTAPIWQRHPMPAVPAIVMPRAERASICPGVNFVNLSRVRVLESVNLSPADRVLDGVNLSPAAHRTGVNFVNLSPPGGPHG